MSFFLDGSSGHAGPALTGQNLLELGGGRGWRGSGEERALPPPRPRDHGGEWCREGQCLRPQPAHAHRRQAVPGSNGGVCNLHVLRTAFPGVQALSHLLHPHSSLTPDRAFVHSI